MQQLDAITLKALAQELKELLVNAKVSKVQHPSAREFLITFWGGPIRTEQRNLFYIHLSPEAPFCALTDTKSRQSTVRTEFEKPTSLCMLLRKHLSGASVLDIRTLEGERVLDIVFENFNELGNKVRLVLSLELMGKHSNMIFYDDVQGTILAVAHGVSEAMSSFRELAAGLPYAPPPRPSGKRLLSEMTTADFTALWAQKPPSEKGSVYLNRHIAGLGQRVIEDVLANLSQASLSEDDSTSFAHEKRLHPAAPPEGAAIYQQLCTLESGSNLAPAIHSNGQTFTLMAPPADLSLPISPSHDWQHFNSVNALVSTYFMGHLQRNRIKRRREQLHQILEQQLKKRQRREDELRPSSVGTALRETSPVESPLPEAFVRRNSEQQDSESLTVRNINALQTTESNNAATSRQSNNVYDNVHNVEQDIAALQAIGDRILAAYSAGEVPRSGPSGKAGKQSGLVALTHYETGEPWVIEIDPSVDWVENAQIYYRRAKKAKARQEAYSQMAEKLNEERAFLESLSQLVAHADTLAELDALEIDMGHAGFGPRAGEYASHSAFRSDAAASEKDKGKASGKSDRLQKLSKHANSKNGKSAKKAKSQTSDSKNSKLTAGVMTLQSSDGLEILLGKSAQGNEAIVGKLSRSDDWWFHVHQMPGSHVLVRAGKEDMPDQTLLEAAMLAAYYSTARHSLNIPVIYTQSKFVRKIPQSYPGHVNYRQEKTVFVSPDMATLEAILNFNPAPLE